MSMSRELGKNYREQGIRRRKESNILFSAFTKNYSANIIGICEVSKAA